MSPDPRPSERERSSFEQDKRAKRLRRQVGQAIADYAMIEHGDRVMVCLSGGKDSYAMLEILRALQAKAPVSFELVAVHLDQKQPGYDPTVLPAYLDAIGIEYHILEQDTYSVVQRVVPEGKTFCGLCSRLRRGALYAFAEQHGFNKIALGHHRDDIVQTLFLNMFHGSRIAAMPPKLQSDDGRNIVIRPLAYVSEADLIEHAAAAGYPIMPCNLCGSQDNLQRKAISAMLQDWERQHPGRIENVFRAMQNIRPSQMADRELFDFAGLGRSDSVVSPTASDWLLGKAVPVEGVLV